VDGRAGPKLVAIANPAAGRGRAARLLPRLALLLDRAGGGQLLLTEYPGHEATLAREASDAGADTLLAIGGDGTWGNVVRGLMASQRRARLALLAAGTGNDLAFAAGIPAHDPDRAVAIARGVRERSIDVGEVDGVYFVNCAGFGFETEVLRAIRRVTWLRGHAVYLVSALRLLFGYRGFEARVEADGVRVGSADDTHHLAVIIAGGPRIGGGFHIAPGARMDDGRLDLVRVADGPAHRRLAVFARAVRGIHEGEPEVTRRAVREVSLSFVAPPQFDADGELHQAGSRDVTVRCHPGALRLAVE